MKISLEVLTSISTKRKRPWSKFAWIGQENGKLLLLGKNNASALSLKTGKTKKNIGKINSVLKTTITTCISSDGVYLTGVLASGNLFVWKKDNDALWTIEGLQNLSFVRGTALSAKISLFVSRSVDVILVVTKLKHVFVWERDDDCSLDPKRTCLDGVWSAVIVGIGIPLPNPGVKDAVVGATILNDPILGKRALCSFIFNNGNCICISTVHLQWQPRAQLAEHVRFDFKVHWHSVQYAFSNLGPLCQPLKSVRAYVPCYSKESLLLALATNQKNAFSSRLLFVAPLTRAVLAVDLQGCGARSELSANKKCYQIADLGWTTNDALLAGVTHHGCFFLLSRLGDLLLISTHGCQMDLNYNHFPNLHPLIKLKVSNKGLANDYNSDSRSTTSILSEKNNAQRFSVTTHPTLPVILCSDGYLATCLLVPSTAEKSIGIMESLVLDANKVSVSLQKQIGVYKEPFVLPQLYKTATMATQTPNTKQQARRLAGKQPMKDVEEQITKKLEEQIFKVHPESPVTSDFDTASSGSSINITDHWSNIQFSSAGKILFGETADGAETVSSPNYMLQRTIQEQDVGKWRNVVSLLVSAWGFAVSNPALWDDKWEVVTSHTVNSFVQLCRLFVTQRLDNSVEFTKSRSIPTHPTHPPIDVPTALLFKCLDLLQFSILHQNLMPAAIALIDGVISVLVHWCGSRPFKARGSLLLEVANVLGKAEAKIISLYSWDSAATDGYLHISGMWHPDVYHRFLHQFKSSGPLPKSDYREHNSSHLEGICKRFTKTWNRVYHAVVSYWHQVQKHEVSEKEYELSKAILIHVQENLQKRGMLHHRKRGRVKEGTFLCLQGCYDEAVIMWNKEKHRLLRGMESSPRVQKKLSHCLHSILYTLLQNCEFCAALQFINTLLVGNFKDNEAIPLALRVANQGSAVRNTVLSMARFLARYFTCSHLFIYPPYKPKVMPSVLDEVDRAKGCMLMSRESVQAVVVGEELSSTWTPEAALSLLLLSGAFAEAAWFTFAVGDWKMAFLLAVVCAELEKEHPSVNKRVSSTKLPLVLQPVEIMATKLTTLLGLKKQPSAITPRSSADITTPKRSSKFSKHTTRDNSYFFANRMQVLTDHMTAGVLSGVDIVPGIVRDGISQLERFIKELPFGVPGNYYLPAPPFYCLQDDGEPVCTASHHEIVSRAEISSTIQLILDIYKSSCTLLPIAFSYAKHLADLQEGKDLTAMKKCTNILESFDQYQDCSIEIPVLPGNKPDVALVDLQGFFRCLCCFVWLLHCRDEMELATRKLWKKLETTLPFSQTNSKRGKLGLPALYWARRLSPFVKFMEWEWDFYQNVLTLVSESSATVEVSNVFAACIPDLSVLPSQMESRVQLLMNLWQTVNVKIASPEEEEDILQQPFKIMWLSDYHYWFSRKYQDLPSNVQHQFGGVPDNEENWSKHWPFETDPEFLEFITVFFDVIIHKTAEEYALKSQIPLLHVCMHDIFEKELLFMAHDVVATVQKKQLLSFSINTKLKDLASQKLASGAHVITMKNSKRQKRLGLFHINNVKSPTACKSLREGGSASITICPTHTHHSTVSSSPMPYVRRTRSVTCVKQQRYPKDPKLKPCRVNQKGINCSLNWGQLLNLCTSSIADSCSILSHVANHTDPMVDTNGALYKSSHLILWLYRWANRASLQLQENVSDNPSFNRPQIRVQIPVDHILAAMTIFKKKCAFHEAAHTANNYETSLNVIQDVMVEPLSKSARNPVVNCDFKPLTGKRNSNRSLLKSKSEDFVVSSRYYEKPSEHCVTVSEENLKIRSSDSADDFHKIQHHKLDELRCLRHGEALTSSVAVQTTNTVIPLHGIAEHKPMINFDHEHQQASKTVLQPSEKPTSEIKLKKSPAVQHHELHSEVQQVVEAQHDEKMEIVNLMSRKNHDAHSTDVCLQSSLCELLPNINNKKSNTSKMDKTESPAKVNKNSKQAADKVITAKLLPCIPKCKTNINLSNSKYSLSMSQHSSKSKLFRSPAGLLNSSVDIDDNTLDDVTSPDSIQMSPPLENRRNIVLKSKKNTVRFAEKVDLQRNNLGFRLLTVDASYLSHAWQDKVAQTMGKSHLCDGRLKKKLSREVPHFLRLKAERDNDDSSSQDVDSNSVSRENNKEYCEIADDGKTADSERLRGGGSRHKPPFPLFTMPPVPLVSPSTPLQMPNNIQVHSTLPHRGYPLLHLPQKYQEKAQTINQNEPCHVCNQDLSCDDSLYVQGRLRQYWQDIQQASFCPATIADSFAPLNPASHPLVPVPLTAPCCPYIPPSWSGGIPYYRHGSSLAQYRLSPYSVIPPSYAVQSIHPQVNVAVESHCRPRAYSETSLLPSGTNVVSQQNVSSNKVASLSTVPSSASTQNEDILSEGILRTGGQCKKSRTLHEVSAALSVSAPNIMGISSVYGPTSDIAVSDDPSLGLVGTTTTHNPPSVVNKTPAQYLIMETGAMLPKTSTKADDAHSMISHGEVHSMQCHNYFTVTQTNNTNSKHKELVESHSPTLASTKMVNMTEPKPILHSQRGFSKEMPPRSPTRSTLNGLPATLLSGDQFDAHQRSSLQASTLLSPESTPKNLSSVPMNRVEFAESHFKAVHELEKAKKLLTDLYRSKQAATKEVQTDADLAAMRLNQALKDLEKTIQEKRPDYDVMTKDSTPKFQTDFEDQHINDCQNMFKTKKGLIFPALGLHNDKAIQFCHKADVCSAVPKDDSTSGDTRNEVALSVIKTHNNVQTESVKSTAPMNCLTPDMILYGRVAPGAKSLKHKPMKTTTKPCPKPTDEILPSQSLTRERAMCQNAKRFSSPHKENFPAEFHSQQAENTNISLDQRDLTSTMPILPTTLTKVLRHTQSPGKCHHLNGYGRSVSQSLPRATESKRPLAEDAESSQGQSRTPKRAKVSPPNPQQIYSNDDAAPLEICDNILSAIHELGIPPEQLTNNQRMQTLDRLRQIHNNRDITVADKRQLMPADAAQTAVVCGTAGVSNVTDSTCELYGRRFQHEPLAQYSVCIPPLQHESEGEQEDNDDMNNQKDWQQLHSQDISVSSCKINDSNTKIFSPPFNIPLKLLTTSQIHTSNTKYLQSGEADDVINVVSHPDTLSGLPSTRYISSPIITPLEKKTSDATNSASPSSLSWPQKHGEFGNITQMWRSPTDTEKHAIPADKDMTHDKFNTLHQQLNNLPDAMDSAVQRMSSNTIRQLYQDITQQQFNARCSIVPNGHFSNTPLPFQTGQENSSFNGSNRQTSGQDITDVAYTSHSELNKIASTNTEDLIDLPSFKIPCNASWSTLTQAAQPALSYNHQTSVAESHNSSQVPQPLQFEPEGKCTRSPLLLLPDVEEAFPQLMNVSARASDPPTEELPRKLAMGTVQRRLQNINDHIKVMEKMSFDLETDFQDSKKLLRNLDVGSMERDIDSLPSAYLLSTTNSEDAVPVNCFQFRFNDVNLPSGKDKQTKFKPSRTNYRNRVKIPRSRSLSPPSSSSKSIFSRGDKDQHNTYNKCRSSSPRGTTHHAIAGSQEASPRRLMKFGSFQQLLLGDKADSFQDVVSSEISSVSHQDRALARQVQKDAHFKLRMQEACQLMDEIVAAEPTRNSSSLSSSTSSPHFGVGKGKQKNIANVQNLLSSRRKQTTAHCGEMCKCCSAEKRQNQNFLHDFDMDDDSMMSYLNSLKFRRRYISENKEEIDRSQESLGRVIAGHANRKAEGSSASRQNNHENADLKPYPSERVRNKSGSSDRINSAYTLPAVKRITTFGRTYSVGQPITVASTIAEVSDETEPTSKCMKARVPEQRHRPISKIKMMKNKAPKKKLAVRMTRAVLLRKKLSKAKESHGTKSRPNVGSSNSCRQQVKHSPCTSTAVKRGQSFQQPERLSTMQTKPVVVSSAKPNVNFSCATSSWEVPGNIRSLSLGSTTNSTAADQTTDDFSYNGFEEDFLMDED